MRTSHPYPRWIAWNPKKPEAAAQNSRPSITRLISFSSQGHILPVTGRERASESGSSYDSKLLLILHYDRVWHVDDLSIVPPSSFSHRRREPLLPRSPLYHSLTFASTPTSAGQRQRVLDHAATTARVNAPDVVAVALEHRTSTHSG